MGRRGDRQGHIECRIMINYKVELSVLRQRLPAPFRPRSMHGYGIAGFCLFRLPPTRVLQRKPSLLLIHRIEAEALFPGQTIPGTYVLRCDVPSGLRRRAFGDFFPNVRHSSRLQWEQPEAEQHLLRMGHRNQPWLEVRAHQGKRFPFDSVMEKLEVASRFFQAGEAWFAPRYAHTLFEQRRWVFSPWQVQPLLIDALEAPYFRRIMHFPGGSFFFDHGLIMHQLNYRSAAPVELIAPRPMRLLFDE